MDFFSKFVFESVRTGHIFLVLTAVAVFKMFDNTAKDWEVKEDDAEY